MTWIIHTPVPHASRPRFASRYPAHVTLKVRDDVPSLRSVKFVREVERRFAVGCERKGFRLVHYTLQGNHAHFIVEANGRDALGRGMKSLGARFARAVNRVFGRSGVVLKDRYHVRILKTPREVRNAIRYVLLNARKHARRVVGRTVDPASSGRWFEGWKRAPVEKALEMGRPGAAPADAPVARARTWLLSTGWRRHGLIDPAEVPG